MGRGGRWRRDVEGGLKDRMKKEWGFCFWSGSSFFCFVLFWGGGQLMSKNGRGGDGHLSRLA